MLENFLRAHAPIERRNGGLLGPHLDSFVVSLTQLGYARETVQKRFRFRYVFDRWLIRRGLALVDLQDAVVNNFLEEQRDNGRLGYGDPQTARDFLDHLRVKGVVRSPEPAADESPVATLGHRAVAGARVSGDDPDLSPCRSSAEGRGPRKSDAVGHAAGAVPARRRAVGLPGRSLIMPRQAVRVLL
jgi:hypothetical protein